MSTSGFWHKFSANKNLQFGMVKKDTVFSAKSSAVTQHVAGKQLESVTTQGRAGLWKSWLWKSAAVRRPWGEVPLQETALLCSASFCSALLRCLWCSRSTQANTAFRPQWKAECVLQARGKPSDTERSPHLWSLISPCSCN